MALAAQSFRPSLQTAEFPEPKPAEEDPDQMKDDFLKKVRRETLRVVQMRK